MNYRYEVHVVHSNSPFRIKLGNIPRGISVDSKKDLTIIFRKNSVISEVSANGAIELDSPVPAKFSEDLFVKAIHST